MVGGQRGEEVAEDADDVRVGPVVQNHAEEVGVGADHGLGLEEVVRLEGDARADGRGGVGEGVVGQRNGVGEVLDYEAELGECGGEGERGVAVGSADLGLFCQYSSNIKLWG